MGYALRVDALNPVRLTASPEFELDASVPTGPFCLTRLFAERLLVVASICYIPCRLGGAMTRGLKLRQAGGSISATLPKDMAERLHLSAGDTVLAIETDRGILLTPYDPEVEEALAIAGRVAGTYRNALRELAK